MDEIEKKIKEVQGQGVKIRENMNKIYPILRHPSFLKQNGRDLVYREHTAETIILFAIELSFGFMFLTMNQIQEEAFDLEEIYKIALKNIEQLDASYQTDQLGNNLFYFFSYGDSYSASRILNSTLLPEMGKIIKGRMGVAIPHQDVLIIADLADAKGASALSQIAFDFAMKGAVPITPLPFLVENGTLEPYLVVHNKKSRHKNR